MPVQRPSLPPPTRTPLPSCTRITHLYIYHDDPINIQYHVRVNETKNARAAFSTAVKNLLNSNDAMTHLRRRPCSTLSHYGRTPPLILTCAHITTELVDKGECPVNTRDTDTLEEISPQEEIRNHDGIYLNAAV